MHVYVETNPQSRPRLPDADLVPDDSEHTLRRATQLCRLYAAILFDVVAMDLSAGEDESVLIVRLIAHITDRLLTEITPNLSITSPARNAFKRSLAKLQARLKSVPQLDPDGPLPCAPPLELLVRLYAKAQTDLFTIEDYERRLPKLITTGVLSRKSSFAIGQPAKLFVCISDSSPLLTTRLPLSSAQQQQGTIGTGPTPTQVHIIASSADHFTGFPLLQDWARDAHEQRKRSFPAQNKDALHLTRAFYEAWHSAMPTESPASRQVLAFWNFVHQWTSQGSAFPSSSTGQPPPTSSYRGAGAGAGAVDLGAAFFDHWDKTATALDARNKLKVCPRCPKCRGIFLFAQSWSSLVSENIDPKQPLQKPSSHTQEFGSGSCAEHLGHLFCLDLCRSRGQGHGYGEAVVTAGGGVVAEEPMQVQGQGQGQGQVQTRNNERLEHSGGWNVVQHHRARGGQRGGAGWGQ